MCALTRMSDKGQVVVPKALRDRKGWPAGTELEVVEAGNGVLLRPRRDPVTRLTMEQAIAVWRALYTHKGPPVPVDDLGWSAAVDDPDQ